MALHFLPDEAAIVSREDAGVDTLQVGDAIRIRGAEAHHAVAVRRVRVGEHVTLGDGEGLWIKATVSEIAGPKDLVVDVTAVRRHPATTPRLTLVQALAKGDRDELAVQAATELGVDHVIPWHAARSVSRWDAAKSAKGVARWQAIVREAAKQAHRPWVPTVSAPVTTAELAARAGASLLLVLAPDGRQALTEQDLSGSDEIVLIVGPEGGMTPEELDRLAAAGARIVRLGDTVLRTSTAGPAALAVVNALLQRW